MRNRTCPNCGSNNDYSEICECETKQIIECSKVVSNLKVLAQESFANFKIQKGDKHSHETHNIASMQSR